MVTLDISSFSDGSSVEERQVTVDDVNLADEQEFSQSIDLKFEINKVGHEFFIKTRFQTNAMLSCDRCLEPFDLHIDDSIDLIFSPNSSIYTETEDDVYTITDSSSEIDVSESIKQALQIAIPFKKVCDLECKGLCPNCGQNLNEKACSCSTTKTDPRWDALKNINFNS